MILDEARVLVRTENMSKSCRLGNDMKEALKELDIRIMQGEFVIIQGLKGAQRKTFFNIMGCLEKPDAGKYFFDYEDIALAKAEALDCIRKNKIGFLFRDANLVNRLTAAENIMIPMHGLSILQQEKLDRLQKALRSFDIEAIAGEKAVNLSDYEKQLVSLARSIVNNPIMIIADEPAANLDNREEKLLIEHLLRLNSEGITIMLLTEKAEVMGMNPYRVISFEAGRISGDKQANTISLVRREA